MEILKKLVMNRENVAKLSHYTAGNLYYSIEIEDGVYQFPVETVETNEDGTLSLSSDLGTTSFDAEIKAATMMRYIRKAIKNDTLVKIT
jgi:hypothetical protein